MAQQGPDRYVRAVWRVVTDPRLVGVAQALPRTVAVVNKSRANVGADGAPVVPISAGLAAQVLLDEVLISVMRNPKLFPHRDDYERAAADIDAGYTMWEERGWLTDPGSYHESPGVPARVRMTRERAFDQRYEHISFASGYAPHEGEPGRDRWLSHIPNRTAHAYVLRHGDATRPWIVCFHGFGMGRASMDLRAFRTGALYWELGLNVAMVVLPMHGPRQTPGTSRGEGFMTIDLVDSLHGLAQAAWDARSVVRWIRAQAGDAHVGVYGISLGGYVASLVASLEPGLACVIAGIPATDIPDLYRRHSTAAVRRRALEVGALGPKADAVHRVVSPLALQPLVAHDRRFIFAGAGDRMSTARQARRLWEHWDRPRIAWYPGGHVGFFMAGGVKRFLGEAFRESGLVTPADQPPVDPGEPGPIALSPGA